MCSLSKTTDSVNFEVIRDVDACTLVAGPAGNLLEQYGESFQWKAIHYLLCMFVQVALWKTSHWSKERESEVYHRTTSSDTCRRTNLMGPSGAVFEYSST